MTGVFEIHQSFLTLDLMLHEDCIAGCIGLKFRKSLLTGKKIESICSHHSFLGKYRQRQGIQVLPCVLNRLCNTLAAHVFWLVWITVKSKSLLPSQQSFFFQFYMYYKQNKKTSLKRNVEQVRKIRFLLLQKPLLISSLHNYRESLLKETGIVDGTHVIRLCGINKSSWYIHYWDNSKCNGTQGNASH